VLRAFTAATRSSREATRAARRSRARETDNRLFPTLLGGASSTKLELELQLEILEKILKKNIYNMAPGYVFRHIRNQKTKRSFYFYNFTVEDYKYRLFNNFLLPNRLI
jgi:hypothetical protein